MTVNEVIREIEAQQDLMVAVAQGGPRIDSVNREYKERRDRIRRGLRQLGLSDPNPYTDLWRWYGRWKASNLNNWQS